jgi:anaerobic selenocysteine-containing dehydrogenase
VFTGFSVRNVANYSEPVFERAADQPDEWEILLKLAGIAQGMGANVDVAMVDDFTLDAFIGSITKDSSSPTNGLSTEQIREQLDATGARGADRMLDLMLRTGPYGDGFGANPNGISLTHMKQHPHGIDFGPLEPRIPEALRTPSGKVELAPEPLLADLPRLAKSMNEFNDEQLVLVGRRHLRSNNSWMHNIEVLVKGKERCTLQMHPIDAQRVGVKEGSVARIASRVGAIDAVVELTSDIRERVVSLPHGWGHDMSGTRMNVAAKRAGVNSNVLTDENEMDPLSGNSVMNGIPVTITPVG